MNRWIPRPCLSVAMSALLLGLAGCAKQSPSSQEQPAESSAVAVSTQAANGSPSRLAATHPKPEAWKRPSRLLYVGLLDTDRARDTLAFLRKHFETVETKAWASFRDADTEGYDVTLLDYDGADTRAPMPSITRAVTRPIMTLGVPGGDLCSRLGLKTGYL